MLSRRKSENSEQRPTCVTGILAFMYQQLSIVDYQRPYRSAHSWDRNRCVNAAETWWWSYQYHWCGKYFHGPSVRCNFGRTYRPYQRTCMLGTAERQSPCPPSPPSLPVFCSRLKTEPEDWTFCSVLQLLWLINVSLHWLGRGPTITVTCPCSPRTYATFKYIRSSSSSSSSSSATIVATVVRA